MWFSIQVILAVVGVLILWLGHIPIAGRLVRNPIANLVGMILASTLPLSVTVLVLLSLLGGSAATPATSPEDAYRLALESYGWIQPALVFAAVLLAGGLTWLGLQQQQELPPLLHDPLGKDVEAGRPHTALGQPPFNDRLATEAIGACPVHDTQELPPEVKTYTAPPDQIPDQIAALGQAECVFASRESSWWGHQPTSYALFRQGLVILQGDDFTLLPFSAMHQLQGNRLLLVDGSTWPLQSTVEHYPHLLQLLEHRIRNRATAKL